MYLLVKSNILETEIPSQDKKLLFYFAYFMNPEDEEEIVKIRIEP